ncbi:phosphatase [Psychroserpens burtonensis]|uniref:Phosphatase n=1 Tax=Psychroserpens burtonensis TaxID=49278 RepID=A0A5C7BCZ3_9FLAO|nr:metallophosphoesterase [Psychroserpens burtonensis]TXE20314.1 phosphatase [Psychroserpens burtonensis]
MLKKIVKLFCAFLLIVIASIALLSRITGIGIKAPDGRYLGYSNEWLFLDYQNIPVRQDGPYVLTENDTRYALYINGDGKAPSEVLRQDVTNEVEVIVDNAVGTQFTVPLRKAYQRSELSIPSPKKLFAISDLEGEFDTMVHLLQVNGVIDHALNWSYGTGHLVLIGDMVDRGRNVVPLLWLIYKLEGEAKLAGGHVHFVLGNHERYLLDGRTKSVASKYYGTFRTTDLSQRELWSEKSELGHWLRSKPVMLKIGSTLFVHAGISPKVLSMDPSLQSIDKEAENNFVTDDVVRRNIDGSVIHDANGILFYRGLALDRSADDLGEKASTAHVNQVLEKFKVDRIAIGHTLATNISHDYDEKVIRVDVHHSGEVSEGLVIKDNTLWRADDKGKMFPLKQVENSTE